jgi:hypothetical protein
MSEEPIGEEPLDDFDFDPQSMADAIGDVKSGEARKYCIRSKQCPRSMTCDYAREPTETTELADLFQGKSANLGDCSNWYIRPELYSSLDVPRRRNGSGSRHNSHAPDRAAAHAELIRKIDAGEPIPYSPYTPEEMKNMLNAARRKKRGF